MLKFLRNLFQKPRPAQWGWGDLTGVQKEYVRDKLEDYGYLTAEMDYGFILAVSNIDADARTAVRLKGLGLRSRPLDLDGQIAHVRYLLGPGPEIIYGGLKQGADYGHN